MSIPLQTELPDLFLFNQGGRVRHHDDWRRRHAEISEALVRIEYGGMPPSPSETLAEELHRSTARGFLNARFIQFRVCIKESDAFGFRLDLLVPAEPGTAPFPVIITGDGCWRQITDEITLEVLKRGMALAQFSRVEIVPDMNGAARQSGLYRVFPQGDYGALSAWAWGYHRCVDVLQKLPEIDPKRIAVVGHSRGGKAALLAGATDERIALTIANNSGAGGAGCFRRQGPDSETLADITARFPHWFARDFARYAGKEEELPFDQHSLKALVAPRPLLTSEALGDAWGNPSGTWLTHLATCEVYRFLGAEENLAIAFRPGEHAQTLADWRTFLDFIDLHFSAKPLAKPFDTGPFLDLPPAHSWRAPDQEARTPFKRAENVQ